MNPSNGPAKPGIRVILSEPLFQHTDEDSEPNTSTVRINNRTIIYEVLEKVKSYRRRFFVLGGCVGALVGLCFLTTLLKASPVADNLFCGPYQENYQTIQHYSKKADNLVGVNLGGWLCLEDWFFSGSVGRYVSTPEQLPQGQGACLPPLVTGPLKAPWASEGHLLKDLVQEHGFEYAAEAFRQHRESFITVEDFRQIRKLGIKSVRIPISWGLFADALAIWDSSAYGAHDPDYDTAIVPDPYYKDMFMATVPRLWFKNLLQQAADVGLRVILDLHNVPGGATAGTYSSVWPNPPVFWTETVEAESGKHVSLVAMGLQLADALVKWVSSDLVELVDGGAVWGVCLLNEPGHMSAGQSWASESDVLRYVESSVAIFRASVLPKRGVRLYVNMIESAFNDFDSVVPHWYRTFFTSEERNTWAVISRHYYTAWSDGCDGKITSGGGYQCDDLLNNISERLQACITSYASDFDAKFDGLRAVTEWSLGTHYDADLACANQDVLRIVFEKNVEAFAILPSHGVAVEPLFWTWQMPYAPKFRPGWDLKYFSGFAGQEMQNSNGRCVVGDWATEDALQSVLTN